MANNNNNLAAQLDCTNLDNIRRLWEHEDNLINHRMTWLGVVQALLFAAYGTLLNLKPNETCVSLEQIKGIQEMIIWVGFFTSALIAIGIAAAIFAMYKIKKICGHNHLGITNTTTIMGWICAGGIPVVFITAWLYLNCIF